MKVMCTFLIALVLGIAGCGSGSSTPPKSYANTDGYPLDVCVVSGQKLGTMGDPYIIKKDGKTVKLCCSKCLKEFNAETAKFMAILEEAEKKKTLRRNDEGLNSSPANRRDLLLLKIDLNTGQILSPR